MGKASWLKEQGLTPLTPTEVGTAVHIAYGTDYLGYLVISDQLKKDAATAIAQLKKVGIRQTMMLTGDNDAIAKQVSQSLGIDHYQSELLPQDKVATLASLTDNRAQNGKVAFVGDGINDTPVLARFTRKIVWQNIAFALIVKAIFLLLGAFGIATMWEAVFADVGVTLIAILNALRIMRKSN